MFRHLPLINVDPSLCCRVSPERLKKSSKKSPYRGPPPLRHIFRYFPKKAYIKVFKLSDITFNLNLNLAVLAFVFVFVFLYFFLYFLLYLFLFVFVFVFVFVFLFSSPVGISFAQSRRTCRPTTKATKSGATA